jgi:ABC-type sugar transport system ATPase subunit
MSTPLLSLKGINKSFGPVHVLKDVHLDIYPGQVTALVGDNGAGKSTLIKCIAGIYTPESGEIIFEGIRSISMAHELPLRSALKSCTKISLSATTST